jgi:hypothetical protein
MHVSPDKRRPTPKSHVSRWPSLGRCVPRVTECPCTVNQFRHTFVQAPTYFGVKESGEMVQKSRNYNWYENYVEGILVEINVLDPLAGPVCQFAITDTTIQHCWCADSSMCLDQAGSSEKHRLCFRQKFTLAEDHTTCSLKNLTTSNEHPEFISIHEALEPGFRFHFVSGYYEVLIVLDQQLFIRSKWGTRPADIPRFKTRCLHTLY